MMKTKKSGKLIAFVLCVAMAFSMSATAFAAEPSEENVWMVNSNSNAIEVAGVLSTEDGSSDNALEPASGKMFYLGKLTAGQIVNVQATWTPSDVNLYIGLVLSGSSGTNLYTGTNGTLNAYTTVPEDGEYYILFANLSTSKPIETLTSTVTLSNPV